MVGKRNTKPLSMLQLQVLRYAAYGYTPSATALAMGKTVDSVRRARQVVRQKLNDAPTMDMAVHRARARGYRVSLPVHGGHDGWVREWEIGREFVEHHRGVPWNRAPIPPSGHSCQAQTRGLVRVTGLPLMPLLRCACGAVCIDDAWQMCNSRSR